MAAPTLLAQAVNPGAFAALHKPVAPEKLLEAVENAVSSR